MEGLIWVARSTGLTPEQSGGGTDGYCLSAAKLEFHLVFRAAGFA
jgi:hypothetical protein